MKSSHELWVEADGDRDRYVALMVEHGHLQPRCQATSSKTGIRCNLAENHLSGLHDFRDLDIFGHPKR